MEDITKIRFRFTDKLLEAGSVLATLALIVIPLAYYHNLPAEVPTHYNFEGLPDDWGARASVWALPVIGILLYAGLTALNRFVVMKPDEKSLTRKSEPIAREKILTLMQSLKLFLGAAFAYVVWMTVKIALGQAEGLGAWYLPTFIVLMTFLPILFLLSGSRKKS